MVTILTDELSTDPLDLVLDNVFSRHPVIDQRSYVMSAIVQLRHTMMRSNQRRAPATAAQELPEWLRCSERFGPYETKLLMRMFHAPGPTIVLRGATGSGKSSALGYLQRAVRRAVKRADRDHLPRFPYHQFIVQLDLQQVPGQSIDPDDDKITQAQFDKLMEYIAKLLAAPIGTLPSDALGEILLKCYADPLEDEEILGARQAVLHDVRERCDPPPSSWSAVTPLERLRTLRAAIKSLDPCDQVMAWLLLYRTIEREINHGASESQTWPMILVFDNIDPLPMMLQQELLRVLTRMVSGATWGSVKLVLPMRLSTFEQHSAAFNFSVYDHESPDPADIIFARLTRFLMTPEVFGAFADAESIDQGVIYARLATLFVHLTDYQSYFRDLLVAMAGANLRSAFHYVQQWCLSGRLQPAHEALWKAAEFKEAFALALGRHALNELASGLGREALDYVRQLGEHWTPAELRKYGTASIVQGLCERVLKVLRGTEAFMPDTPEGSSSQSLDARSLRDAFVKALHEEIRLLKLSPNDPGAGSRSARSMGSATKILCHAISRCNERALRHEVDASFLRQIIHAVNGQAIAGIRGLARSNHQSQERPLEVLELLSEWLSLALSLAGTETRSAREWRWFRKQPVNVESGNDKLGLPVSTELNRYEAERLLLVPGRDHGAAGRHVVNVFAVGRDSAAPVVLRALYYLRQRVDGHVTRGELFNFLKLHSYSDEEIMTAMVSMFNVEQRLIFSGVRDHLEGIERWLSESSRVVHLSNAGVGYITVLLVVPAYLQWALWDVSSIRAFALAKSSNIVEAQRQVRGRLLAARYGFEYIIDDERKRIEEAWASRGGRTRQQFIRMAELGVQNACCDVFFRSIESFMHVYKAHWSVQSGRSRESRAEAEATASEALAWVDLGDEAIEHHRELFGTDIPAWSEALDHARRDVDTMSG